MCDYCVCVIVARRICLAGITERERAKRKKLHNFALATFWIILLQAARTASIFHASPEATNTQSTVTQLSL